LSVTCDKFTHKIVYGPQLRFGPYNILWVTSRSINYHMARSAMNYLLNIPLFSDIENILSSKTTLRCKPFKFKSYIESSEMVRITWEEKSPNCCMIMTRWIVNYCEQNILRICLQDQVTNIFLTIWCLEIFPWCIIFKGHNCEKLLTWLLHIFWQIHSSLILQWVIYWCQFFYLYLICHIII
jgi:hypothetical protein